MLQSQYETLMQPVGFLSREGAAGEAAHVVVTWSGKAGVEWQQEDQHVLQLTATPRHREILPMASYPYTKLLTMGQRTFTLQISEGNASKYGNHALHMSEVKLSGSKLQAVKVATLQWPSEVTRRMSFLCQPYDNEEKTLASSRNSR